MLVLVEAYTQQQQLTRFAQLLLACTQNVVKTARACSASCVSHFTNLHAACEFAIQYVMIHTRGLQDEMALLHHRLK